MCPWCALVLLLARTGAGNTTGCDRNAVQHALGGLAPIDCTNLTRVECPTPSRPATLRMTTTPVTVATLACQNFTTHARRLLQEALPSFEEVPMVNRFMAEAKGMGMSRVEVFNTRAPVER